MPSKKTTNMQYRQVYIRIDVFLNNNWSIRKNEGMGYMFIADSLKVLHRRVPASKRKVEYQDMPP